MNKAINLDLESMTSEDIENFVKKVFDSEKKDIEEHSQHSEGEKSKDGEENTDPFFYRISCPTTDFDLDY